MWADHPIELLPCFGQRFGESTTRQDKGDEGRARGVASGAKEVSAQRRNLLIGQVVLGSLLEQLGGITAGFALILTDRLFRQGIVERTTAAFVASQSMFPRGHPVGELGEDFHSVSILLVLHRDKFRWLTRERLHQHGKGLARHIQLCGSLHHSNDFGDDGVLFAADAAVESNDTDDGRSISFKGHDIVLGVLEQVQRDHSAFIVLEAAVTAHVLKADSHVRQFPVQSPSVAIVHGHDVGLAVVQLAKDDHARSRRIDGGSLVQHLGRSPGITDPHRRVPPDPVGDHGRVVLLRQLFKVDPRFDVGQLEGVAHDGPRHRARWLKSSEYTSTHGNMPR